jgi:hypothetical protein
MFSFAFFVLAGVASAATTAIPHFRQCDPRWGADVIGTRANASDDSTICRVGCAMTSLAMLLAGLEVPGTTLRPLRDSLNPGSLNIWLRDNGGYDCVDVRPDDPVCFNLVSAAVRSLTPKVTFQGYVSPAPPLSQMAAALRPRNSDGDPLSAEKAYLAHVHDSHHFVLVTAVIDGGVRVMDPFFNTSFYPYANVSGALVYLLHTADNNSTDFVPFTYPTYKQCDGRWGADVIETTTVCKVGCLMSSTSMALAGHGIDVGGKGANPGSLNAWLRAHNGYTPTNDFEESALDSVSSLLSPGAVRWPKDGMHTKNDLNWTVLRDYLSAKPPRVVIANVLHGHHFVLTVGLSGDGDTILVNDPGFDKTNYSYSKVVFGWRIFDMKI